MFAALSQSSRAYGLFAQRLFVAAGLDGFHKSGLNRLTRTSCEFQTFGEVS